MLAQGHTREVQISFIHSDFVQWCMSSKDYYTGTWYVMCALPRWANGSAGTCHSHRNVEFTLNIYQDNTVMRF